MIEKPGIWQAERGTVFKLRNTGVTKKNGVFIDTFENEYSFGVNYTPEDRDMSQTERSRRENEMATKIANILNTLEA